MRFTAADEEFRQSVRDWLEASLTMTVAGTGALAAGSAEFDRWQRLFLFSRADTIYGGSDEIQHDIIATRALGLPR